MDFDAVELQATRLLTDAVRLYEALDDPRGVATALFLLGRLFVQQGRIGLALKQSIKLLSTLRPVGLLQPRLLIGLIRRSFYAVRYRTDYF